MKSVNILCLGDSLTAGYSQAGTVHHPYGMALQSSLEKALPLLNITVDVRGLDGDQVISPPGFFLPRMNILCESCYPSTSAAIRWKPLLQVNGEIIHHFTLPFFRDFHT
jgi:hypothetical protein